MAEKRKPLGKAIILEEALSDEAAAPTERDIERAEELVKVDPMLEAMYNAKTEVEDPNNG